MLLVEKTLRGPHEASYDKIIPSEDVPVKDLPKKNGDFGPIFEFPDFRLAGIRFILRDDSEMVRLFDGVHALRFISPLENVSTKSGADTMLLNVLP